MPIIFNIGGIKINSISANGFVNFGYSFIPNPTSNDKSQGSNSSIGDLAPANSIMGNLLNDSDLIDQNSLDNTPLPVNNQI